MINTKNFYDYLICNGIDFFCGVPDSLLKEFCACVQANSPREKNIICANEGNAIALASGFHLASGKYGCVYMQNSGLGNAVNPLVSLADEEVYGIPMLLLIGWRGEPGTADEPQHKKQGKITLSLLETLGIRYMILEDAYEEQIQECISHMQDTNQSVALVVKKNTFEKYAASFPVPYYELTREEAVEEIVRQVKEDDFIVSTTGKTSRELYEIRERRGQGHDNDFLTVGSMGHTASLALGISLFVKQNVYCIDGDGSFLMHMGSLGIAADTCRRNLKYILINNGAHDSVGGQPTIGFDIHVREILLGLGFQKVIEVKTKAELEENFCRLKDEKTAMIIYCRKGSRVDLGRPDTTPQQNKLGFMKKIKEVLDESNHI